MGPARILGWGGIAVVFGSTEPRPLVSSETLARSSLCGPCTASNQRPSGQVCFSGVCGPCTANASPRRREHLVAQTPGHPGAYRGLFVKVPLPKGVTPSAKVTVDRASHTVTIVVDGTSRTKVAAKPTVVTDLRPDARLQEIRTDWKLVVKSTAGCSPGRPSRTSPFRRRGQLNSARGSRDAPGGWTTIDSGHWPRRGPYSPHARSAAPAPLFIPCTRRSRRVGTRHWSVFFAERRSAPNRVVFSQPRNQRCAGAARLGAACRRQLARNRREAAVRSSE
jgi:hypothetical protein